MKKDGLEKLAVTGHIMMIGGAENAANDLPNEFG